MVAPRNRASSSSFQNRSPEIRRDSTIRNAKFWLNISLAFFFRPSPNEMETTVEVPTANIRDRANSAVTNGDAILMAVMAVTETPFATNSPSTAVYRVYTH